MSELNKKLLKKLTKPQLEDLVVELHKENEALQIEELMKELEVSPSKLPEIYKGFDEIKTQEAKEAFYLGASMFSGYIAKKLKNRKFKKI